MENIAISAHCKASGLRYHPPSVFTQTPRLIISTKSVILCREFEFYGVIIWWQLIHRLPMRPYNDIISSVHISCAFFLLQFPSAYYVMPTVRENSQTLSLLIKQPITVPMRKGIWVNNLQESSRKNTIIQTYQNILTHCSLLSGAILLQVMACFLTAPSHYLNQCWLIINGVLWHSPKTNFTENAQAINP